MDPKILCENNRKKEGDLLMEWTEKYKNGQLTDEQMRKEIDTKLKLYGQLNDICGRADEMKKTTHSNPLMRPPTLQGMLMRPPTVQGIILGAIFTWIGVLQ